MPESPGHIVADVAAGVHALARLLGEIESGCLDAECAAGLGVLLRLLCGRLRDEAMDPIHLGS